MGGGQRQAPGLGRRASPRPNSRWALTWRLTDERPVLDANLKVTLNLNERPRGRAQPPTRSLRVSEAAMLRRD